jgi:hypothetical protein
MVVMWAQFISSVSSVSDYVCEYGSAASNLTYLASATVTSYKVSSPAYTSPMLFTCVMSGFEVGNIEYYYRVGSKYEGYSDAYSFKSHPGVGANM